MGNCVSSASAAKRARARDKEGKVAFLDFTEQETSHLDLDATLPLSPMSSYNNDNINNIDSTITTTTPPSTSFVLPSPSTRMTLGTMLSSPSPLSLHPHLSASSSSSSSVRSPKSPQRPSLATTLSLSNASSMSLVSSSSMASSCSPKRSSSMHKHNRALQARLDKARSVQRALLNHSSPSSPNKLERKQLSQEFEATFDASTIWSCQTYENHHVTALAFPKSSSTASESVVPSLLLAVGTAQGMVVLTTIPHDQHLLDPSSPSCASSIRLPASSLVLPSPPSSVNKENNNTSSNGNARILSPANGRTIRALAFNPTENFVASGGDDCLCTIWKLTWKKKKRQRMMRRGPFHDDNDNDDTFEEEKQDQDLDSLLASTEVVTQIPRVDRIYALQYSSSSREDDGNGKNNFYLAIGGFDGTVAIYSPNNQYQLVTEICRDGLIYGLDWSFDRRYLAIVGSDKTVAIVDTSRSWQVWKEVKLPGSKGGGAQQVVQFRPKSYSLAVGGSHLSIVKDWTVKHQISFGTNDDSSNNNSNSNNKLYKVTSLSWSPTGTYLVLVDSLNTCRLLETSGYSVVHELHRPQPLHSVVWGEEILSSSSCNSIPRRYICVGGEGDESQVVILKAGLEFHSSNGSVGGDDLSSSAGSSIMGSSIMSGEWVLQENVFRDVEEVLDMSSSRIMVDKEHVLAVTFSCGSRSRPSTFFAYSLEDGRVIVRSTLEWKVVAELLFSKPIKCLEFSLGSRFLALGSGESRVHVVETAPSWQVVARHDFFAPINSLGFSKRNERLAVGVDDGILALFDPQDDYASVGQIDVSDSAVLTLDWSTKNFCLGRQDGTVSIYDASQVCSNFCVPLAEHELCSPVKDVAFGPNSRFLAVGASNGLVNVYSNKGGWVLCHQLNGPVGLSSMCWNASGRLLALGGKDGAVKMVDTIFWADVDELDDLASADKNESLRTVSSMSFGQDGNMFAFVSPDGDGVRVVDTNKWKTVFSHRGEGGETEASSLSS